MITQETLRQLFLYCPETGIFTNRIRRSNATAGEVAGTTDSSGYLVIRIDYKLYRAHRLAHLYMTGSLPDYVDHKNMVRSDNRWCNLRAATNSQNMMNVPAPRHNTSGVKGVTWHKAARKWSAQIQLNGEKIYLGIFQEKTDAIKARKAAEETHFGEFVCSQ